MADRRRQLVPRAPVQLTAGALLENSAPLFEEERDASGLALIPDVGDPGLLHRRAPGPDSPPTMTQSMSRSGSSERNFTGAPVPRKWSMRWANRRFSTLTPI